MNSSFTGPALVMHPDNSDDYNVAIGYKNNTGKTIDIEVDIALSLLFPANNSDGVVYSVEREIPGDDRYVRYVLGNLPANSTNTNTFSHQNIELQSGELLYLTVHRGGVYFWDFTKVEFNVLPKYRLT